MQQPSTPTRNIPHATVLAAIQSLGIDPNRVGRLEITPRTLTWTELAWDHTTNRPRVGDHGERITEEHIVWIQG